MGLLCRGGIIILILYYILLILIINRTFYVGSLMFKLFTACSL